MGDDCRIERLLAAILNELFEIERILRKIQKTLCPSDKPYDFDVDY
jgi:hypothetical protein